LEELGFNVTLADVGADGIVDLSAIKDAITESTVLVSVMHANNEVGTIQPVREIADIAHSAGALFHTDAVQSFGLLNVNVDNLGADLLSLSSHKIYGPKGVGALYVRTGTQIAAVARGGGQERGRRSGTENVAGIVGFAEATRLMLAERAELALRLTGLRDRFIDKASARIPQLHINGHRTRRLPNNINFSIPGVEGESMLLNLDLAGIAASSGSACSAASIEPSHVLIAMNLSPENLRSAMRFTLGRSTTWDQLEWVIDTVDSTTARLRAMSKHAMAF
jgi:cysteine desulfurase